MNIILSLLRFWQRVYCTYNSITTGDMLTNITHGDILSKLVKVESQLHTYNTITTDDNILNIHTPVHSFPAS